MNRRRLLATVGSVFSLSGCLRLQSGNGSNSPTPPPTVDDAPSGTDEPSIETTTDQESTPEPDTPTPPPASGPLSGSWPQYSLDAANSGYVPDGSGPTGDVMVRWRHDVDDLLTSSPVVANGIAFITVHGKSPKIVAIDTQDGAELWVQSLQGASPISSPAVLGDRVYVVSMNGDVFGLDTEAGSYVWQASIDEQPFAAPTVVEDTVVLTSMEGSTYAFDRASGDERWRYQPEAYAFLSTPAVAGDTVFVTSLTPLELPDGVDELFEFNPPPQFFMWNDLGEDPMATVASLDARGTVHALDRVDGTRIWTQELPDFVVSSPAVGQDSVVVGCWDHQLYALDRASGTERWTHETDAPITSTPAIAGRSVYVGGWDGNLYSVDRSSGEREWFLPLGSKSNAPPAVVGDTVYAVADNRGIVAASTSGRRRWEFTGPIGDYNASAPAVVDGSLLVCGDSRSVDEERELGSLFRLDGA